MSAAQVLALAAAENPSYAGPFAYNSQASRKVFMGESPCVPLDVLSKSLQAGNEDALKEHHKNILRNPDTCSSACRTTMNACFASVPGDSISEKMNDGQLQSCLRQAMTCHEACAAKPARKDVYS